MNLLQSFKDFIQQEHLFSAKDRLLVAVSGGIDSVVLCELCAQARFDFVMVHCNFQLRSAESERDEAFVRQLGKQYNKSVLVKRFSTEEYAVEKKISIQVAARELRYAWFNSIIKGGEISAPAKEKSASVVAPCPFSCVLTAHHLDDNIETLLMNFFKGTGVAGLRGMLPKQGHIARPLLFAKKSWLQAFASDSGLSWVEDSSNQSDKYTRNYFRNRVIPFLQEIYPGVENNLSDNLQRFKEAELLYQQAIEVQKKYLLEYKEHEVHIPVLKLKKAVPLLSIVYEIIRQYGFGPEQATEAIRLLHSDTGKYIQSATHQIIKNRNWLIISPLNCDKVSLLVIEAGETDITFERGILRLKLLPQPPLKVTGPSTEAYLDAKQLVFPLLLRKWKTGDYFYPLGMQKKKKLVRFFIDQKLSKTDKEKIWVLESGKKIIWIAGWRIDDRFKITARTKATLQLRLQT